jgi:hypothetical protein
MGRAEAREAGPLGPLPQMNHPQKGGKRGCLWSTGSDEESETITPLTHLALLTSEEAQKVELWDFFREDEDTLPRFDRPPGGGGQV